MEPSLIKLEDSLMHHKDNSYKMNQLLPITKAPGLMERRMARVPKYFSVGSPSQVLLRMGKYVAKELLQNLMEEQLMEYSIHPEVVKLECIMLVLKS